MHVHVLSIKNTKRLYINTFFFWLVKSPKSWYKNWCPYTLVWPQYWCSLRVPCPLWNDWLTMLSRVLEGTAAIGLNHFAEWSLQASWRWCQVAIVVGEKVLKTDICRNEFSEDHRLDCFLAFLHMWRSVARVLKPKWHLCKPTTAIPLRYLHWKCSWVSALGLRRCKTWCVRINKDNHHANMAMQWRLSYTQHLYSKIGFKGVFFFLTFALNEDCGYSLEPPQSMRRF